MRIPPLRTPRLTVRELDSGDHAAIEDVEGGDRERWLRWTELSYGQLAELRQPPYGERGIVLNDSGRLVGLVGLVPSLGPFGLLPSWPEPGRRFVPAVGLYWAVAPAFRRRGIAAEAAAALIDHAFAELCLARVVATTERENVASIGVMRRLGMRVEENPEPEPAWFQVVGVLEARPTGGSMAEVSMGDEGSIQFVIRFRGGDFETWKAAFDAHEPVRVKHGATGHWIARSIDDPNEFIGVVEFTSRGGARAYAADVDRLEVQHALMAKGGPHHRTWDEGIHETVAAVRYQQ